jgi:hypothetical protein
MSSDLTKSDYESVGRKFESCRAHHKIKGLQT